MILYDQNIWGNFKESDRIANRNLLISRLIKKYLPDICCFQECNPLTSRAGEDAIQKLLCDEYLEACPRCEDINFTPVFYRRDTLREIDCGYKLFEGLNDRNSKSYTWALLEEIATGKRAIFISVHFWWKWDSETDELQRLQNAAELSTLCEGLTEKYGVPIIVSGDLNSGINAHQGNLAYNEMIRLGMRDVRYLSCDSTELLTAHAIPTLNENGEYECEQPNIKTLDYVFLWGATEVKCKRFSVLVEKDALASSDHCPLIFDFEL